MKKRVYSHIGLLFFFLFLYFPLISLSTIFTLVFYQSIDIIVVISMSFGWLLLLCGFFVLNRFCPVLIYDDVNKTITRKGFFFDFKYTIKIEEIMSITMVSLQIDGQYFVLVDGKHNEFYSYSRKAPIRVPFTQKGIAFIRFFYDGYLPC